MSRILAVDYGKKRTGLAVTDPLQIIANGLATVPTAELYDYLVKYTQTEQVELIVVGEPKQPNGEPSENLARGSSWHDGENDSRYLWFIMTNASLPYWRTRQCWTADSARRQDRTRHWLMKSVPL